MSFQIRGKLPYRRLRFAVAALAALAGLTGASGGAARADERVWTVKEVSGAVRMHHNGDGWMPLKVGDRIQPGSRIKTAAEGRLVLVRPGDSIDVAPNSRFDIPFANEPNAKAPVHILQTMGTLLFKITTRPENPFGVKTPYLAAVIKGTTFTVSVDGPRSALHVSQGAVEVTSILSGQVVMVRPGMTATIDGASGGTMQVLGQRRSDSGSKAGKGAKTAAKTAERASTADANRSPAGARNTLISRPIGVQRINVFESSGGLVRDARSAPSNQAGINHGPRGGHALARSAARNGLSVDRSPGRIANATLGGGPANGNGLGLGKGNGLGLGNGVGLGNGNGGGLGLPANGAPTPGGNGNGNAGGNGNGNAGSNGNAGGNGKGNGRAS